jgi:putative ABC transport system permease protein
MQWVLSFWQDIRHGWRLLTRAPGFAFAAIAMLGLGVGSATAIFAIVNSVLLRPLPYQDSERIVTVAEVDENGRQLRVSLPTFQEWMAQTRSFEAIAASRGDSTTVVTGQQSQRVYVLRFHGDVLRVFGSAAAHGRLNTLDETEKGVPIAIVSHAFARGVWNQPARAVGESIELAGVGFTIIGVLEPASDERTDVFVPATAFGPDPSGGRDRQWTVTARLRADAPLSAARSEMQTIARRLHAERTSAIDSHAVIVSSLLDATVRGARPALMALLAAGALLLLIACANVANLLVARGLGRRREIAVRGALGAGRGRIVRQLLAESVPLVVLSAAAGITVAHWSFTGLLAMVPFGIPRRAEIAMDASTVAFGILVAVAAGVCCAVAPALHTPTRRLAASLASSGRTAPGGDGTLRHALVAWQFALALAVLSCAGLLTKSFVRLARVDTGFDYSHALMAETELPETSYATDAALTAFWRTAIDRVSMLPGVEAVGLAESAPFEGRYPNGAFEFLDEPGRSGDAFYGMATVGFFQALRIPLLQGRLFDDRDVPAAPHVAVINRLAAERFWPGQNPIGRRVRWLGTMDGYAEPLTVVGVIGDVRHQSLTVEPVPEIYAHFFQRPSRARDADLVIRATNPAALTPTVRHEFETLNRELPVRFHTLDESYRQSLAQPRFQMLLIGFFAVCAVLLSAAGLYSSMAYAVSRQAREIGIRLALGGAPGAVRREVLGTAMRIAAMGSLVGVLLGAAAGQVIANQLFGVSAHDAGVFGAATVVLALTALLAADIPARRASRTNPIQVLRCD